MTPKGESDPDICGYRLPTEPSSLVERLREHDAWDLGIDEKVTEDLLKEAADALERMAEEQSNSVKMLHAMGDEIDKHEATIARQDEHRDDIIQKYEATIARLEAEAFDQGALCQGLQDEIRELRSRLAVLEYKGQDK